MAPGSWTNQYHLLFCFFIGKTSVTLTGAGYETACGYNTFICGPEAFLCFWFKGYSGSLSNCLVRFTSTSTELQIQWWALELSGPLKDERYKAPILPGNLWEECSSADTVILTQEDTFSVHDLQNCELISVCCLNTLCLCDMLQQLLEFEIIHVSRPLAKLPIKLQGGAKSYPRQIHLDMNRGVLCNLKNSPSGLHFILQFHEVSPFEQGEIFFIQGPEG